MGEGIVPFGRWSSSMSTLLTCERSSARYGLQCPYIQRILANTWAAESVFLVGFHCLHALYVTYMPSGCRIHYINGIISRTAHFFTISNLHNRVLKVMLHLEWPSLFSFTYRTRGCQKSHFGILLLSVLDHVTRYCENFMPYFQHQSVPFTATLVCDAFVLSPVHWLSGKPRYLTKSPYHLYRRH